MKASRVRNSKSKLLSNSCDISTERHIDEEDGEVHHGVEVLKLGSNKSDRKGEQLINVIQVGNTVDITKM